MLYLNTITPATLELLKKLQNKKEFNQLRLVGGTALALHIGHRKSIDIDLFGKIKIDRQEILNILSSIGKTTQLKSSENINIFLVNNIKVDIVNYPYNWLAESKIENEIVLADLKDIAAMKLAAITGRGTKKDFIDLYFLLKQFSLNNLLSFYENKYNDGSIFMVLKSLAYFDDADKDVDPIAFVDYKWEKVKKAISNEIINNNAQN